MVSEIEKAIQQDSGVPAAFSHKPDPDEPWRYVCPDCGGQIRSRPKHVDYWCDGCGSHVDRLYDKKNEVNVPA